MEKYNINPNHMFSGDLGFLSNMYICPVQVELKGSTYLFHNTEAAFQAGKCVNTKDIELLAQLQNGYDAKRLGRKVTMDPNWDNRKVDWMRHVCECKFTQNDNLRKKLVETYPLELVETNTWKDTFWGVCKGKGQNHLGKILSELREKLLQQTIDTDTLQTVTMQSTLGEAIEQLSFNFDESLTK